jgi:hypothetical protein
MYCNCFLFGGLCNNHPCPFYPLPDLNGCPFGCVIETVTEPSPDLSKIKNDKSYSNKDLKERSYQHMVKEDVKNDFHLTYFVNEEDGYRCVIESCAAYANDTSCLNDTEKKCLTTTDGCRCCFNLYYFIF